MQVLCTLFTAIYFLIFFFKFDHEHADRVVREPDASTNKNSFIGIWCEIPSFQMESHLYKTQNTEKSDSFHSNTKLLLSNNRTLQWNLDLMNLYLTKSSI